MFSYSLIYVFIHSFIHLFIYYVFVGGDVCFWSSIVYKRAQRILMTSKIFYEKKYQLLNERDRSQTDCASGFCVSNGGVEIIGILT